jgi:hypothetical protein
VENIRDGCFPKIVKIAKKEIRYLGRQADFFFAITCGFCISTEDPQRRSATFQERKALRMLPSLARRMVKTFIVSTNSFRANLKGAKERLLSSKNVVKGSNRHRY